MKINHFYNQHYEKKNRLIKFHELILRKKINEVLIKYFFLILRLILSIVENLITL